MTVKRRRVGVSGYSYTIDGTKAPGVTTVIGMVPKNLTDWAARTAADYAIDHWSELEAVPLSKRQKLIAEAHRVTRDAAGKRGTEVHKLGEALVAGEPVPVPVELAGHVEAYRDWLDAVEPKPVEGGTELLVASREHTYCGTGDLIADLPDVLAADGEFIPACRWLLDLKTAASGVWPESALRADRLPACRCVRRAAVLVPGVRRADPRPHRAEGRTVQVRGVPPRPSRVRGAADGLARDQALRRRVDQVRYLRAAPGRYRR